MEKYFSSPDQVFSWLSRFINFESGQSFKEFRLERMEALAEFAGNPERCVPSIHIAGSKGKGSVTGMIASILEADGRRAARYMSPHISDYRERICLGNNFFDDEVYCAAGDKLRNLAESDAAVAEGGLFDPARPDDIPSFFEMLTLLFFYCAVIGRCDVMVVETGMGGRLDATNIVNPLVSVITLIELEHTAFLGNTIAAIAGEKAGIIKQGRPLILARQKNEALEVFVKRAEEKNSPLFYFPDAATIENICVLSGSTNFNLAFHEKNPQSHFPNLFQELSIFIPGAVHAENAALAIMAVKTAFPEIGEEAIRQGLRQVKIPGRFEKISPSKDPAVPPFVIDGAHTPESVSLCVDTFRALYGSEGLLLFGCAADKDAAGMADILLPFFSQVIITTPGTFRASEPEKVFQSFSQGLNGKGAEKTIFIKDINDAVKRTLETSREKNLPVLCTGSFYLIAEARNLFNAF